MSFDNSFDRDDLRDNRDFLREDRRQFVQEREMERILRERDRDRQDDSIIRMELERSNLLLREIINDPDIVVDDVGRLVSVPAGTKVSPRRPQPTGRDVIRSSGQFSRANILPRFEKPKRKRSAAMKKSDKKLSAAFKKANATCRKKNGQFKKGKCQADVAKMAHRLRKKMK